jgi:ABC-type multidrug transport system ATPase subunit
VHIPTLTVDETLHFAARLRVGEDYSDEERELRVNSVIDLLGLTPCRQSMVGDSQTRGISGGQVCACFACMSAPVPSHSPI